MGRNRKTFTDSFKKEVALEALKERITVNEIAAKYGISGSMVSNWKKQFLSGGFSKEVKQLKKELAEAQRRIEETYVDSIAIFGISSIPIFRIGKDMVFPPFGKCCF